MKIIDRYVATRFLVNFALLGAALYVFGVSVDVVIQANGIAANVVTVADPITGPDFGRRNEPLQPILIPKLPQLTQFLNADPGIVLSRRGTMPCYFPTDNLFLSS